VERPVGQYDDIIASYLEKQAGLQARLRLLRAGEKRPGQRTRSAEQAAIQRLEREIRDLEDAIARCRGRSGRPGRDRRRPAASGAAQAGVRPLIVRCPHANRVILTGIEVDDEAFATIRRTAVMRCRFCGQEHAWELAERPSDALAPMPLGAEDFAGRSVVNGAHAAHPTDVVGGELHQRRPDNGAVPRRQNGKAGALP
jgi:hypothetical protein